MCLAIPGKIVEFHESAGVRMGKVDFGGITREACMEYVADARLGDFVMVHVGFAISKVDEEEAARTYKFLEEMDQLQELEDGEPEGDLSRGRDAPMPGQVKSGGAG